MTISLFGIGDPAEEDKITVERARRIKRFLSHPEGAPVVTPAARRCRGGDRG